MPHRSAGAQCDGAETLHTGVYKAFLARRWAQGIEAVRNAILEPWSNGQTGGQINRPKTLKRSMYGRAGIELLRARMLPIYESNLHRTGLATMSHLSTDRHTREGALSRAMMLALHLPCYLARERRVLLIDLDHQSSLSIVLLGARLWERGGTRGQKVNQVFGSFCNRRVEMPDDSIIIHHPILQRTYSQGHDPIYPVQWLAMATVRSRTKPCPHTHYELAARGG